LFGLNSFSPALLIINPQATTILAIIILFLLILSFVLAGSEVAFFSLTYKDINILKTKQDASWKRIVTLLEEPRALLASLLIANSIINIAIIILSNFLIDEMVLLKQNFWLFEFLIKVVLVGFVMVLFGEVMPKIWATQNNLQFAYYTSGIIELVHLLFRRVSNWAVHRSERLERFFGSRKSAFSLEKLDPLIMRLPRRRRISSKGSSSSAVLPSSRSCGPGWM
jgi:putative hemolysin